MRKSLYKESLLRKVINLYGLSVVGTAAALKVSQPTMDYFFKDPRWMRGHHRVLLAALLSLTIEQVDDIINENHDCLERIIRQEK